MPKQQIDQLISLGGELSSPTQSRRLNCVLFERQAAERPDTGQNSLWSSIYELRSYSVRKHRSRGSLRFASRRLASKCGADDASIFIILETETSSSSSSTDQMRPRRMDASSVGRRHLRLIGHIRWLMCPIGRLDDVPAASWIRQNA